MNFKAIAFKKNPKVYSTLIRMQAKLRGLISRSKFKIGPVKNAVHFMPESEYEYTHFVELENNPKVRLVL